MPKYQAIMPYHTTEWYKAEFEAPDDHTAFVWSMLMDFWGDGHPNQLHVPHPSIKWKPYQEDRHYCNSSYWGDDCDAGSVTRIVDNDTKGEK